MKPRVLGIGLLVGFVVLVIIANMGGGGSSASPHSPTGAYLICQQFVTDRLRAPATADFPASTDLSVVSQHRWTGHYDVTAHVDSQNGFGALIRSPFACTVTWQQGNTWKLDSLTIK